MSDRSHGAPGWGDCKAKIRDWSQSDLIALLHELYQLTEENRSFLQGRLLPERGDQVLEKAQKGLEKLLSVSAIFRGRFQHRLIKQAVEQFAKGVGDDSLLARLLLFDLETGFQSFAEVGDYEALVDHLYWALNRLEKVLNDLPVRSRPPLVERLGELARAWGAKFGYGLSDELVAMAQEWQRRMEARDSA